MTKKYIFSLELGILFMCLFSLTSIYAENDIGYVYYDNMAANYNYSYSIQNTEGNIFIDSNNILHVINPKGSFEFDSTGQLIKHKNELEQIPIKIDSDNNIFLRDKNIIKKLNNIGKLAYTIDIMPGEEFIFIDKEEKFYFLTKRDLYDDNLSYEKDNLIKEIKNLAEEKEKLKTKDSPFFRDYDYNQRQFKDNEQRLIEMEWELTKMIDGYEHLWKVNLFSQNATQQTEINNRLNTLYDEIKRKKEDIYDYKTQQYDLIKRQAKLDEYTKDKEYEIVQKEKETKQKLEETENLIKEDLDRKFMIKIADQKEQILKRIPLSSSSRANSLWECVNITSDNEGNYYGVYKNRIYIYDSEGKPIASFGKYGSHQGEIINISQIAVDSKKSIYVVDSGNNRISKYNIK